MDNNNSNGTYNPSGAPIIKASAPTDGSEKVSIPAPFAQTMSAMLQVKPEGNPPDDK